MRRRTFLLSSLTLAVTLSGCSGPVLKSMTTLPATAFTPAEFERVYSTAGNIRDIVAVYGQPPRLMNDPVRHPNQKGYVWEYITSRPSFYSNPAERDSLTPTMKKEIHVWRNTEGQLTGHEIVGTFYVQEKRKWLPMMIRHLRPLTQDEIMQLRVPVGPGERTVEVDQWYRAKGE